MTKKAIMAKGSGGLEKSREIRETVDGVQGGKAIQEETKNGNVIKNEHKAGRYSSHMEI